jgi:class 3 adenylate cyclase/tetratricopeptide (TPR) repeat protein
MAAMQPIAEWLEKLGLGHYAQRFAENGIDLSDLRHLTDQDLKDIGVLLGHRRRMLAAISELAGAAPAAPGPATTTAAPAIRQDSAERRQLTVMFCDLVGSTALSTKLDPEDLHSVIGAYHKCAAETIARFDGFVAKYMGDGVLIYFGYPQAHEDDAERAVRAGLALVEAVGKLGTEDALQVRIGVATGLVVVGDLVGSGEAQERGVVGETPNLAARLQAIAAPNTVVMAEGTRRLLGNLFELEDLRLNDLKGIAGPAPAWTALRASSVESRFDALHTSGLTALVGRDEETELLRRRWARAKAGEGQVVLIAGEAGIGKSRLTAALMESLGGEPHTRLRYFCSPQHTDSALYPIIGQMERATRLAHDDTPHARLDKLDAMLAQTSTSIEDAALFAEMLSLPNDGRYPTLTLAPQQRRQRTLDALLWQVEALTRQGPVLMILEDAHWVDPTSLEVFGRLVARIAPLHVLLIVTFRPEFSPPWIGQPYVMAMTINRLTQREAGAIVDVVIGNKLLPAGVRQDIIERTDGIPLFVEEMTKAVLEAESEGAAQSTVAAVPSSALAIPASLHASLMARLDRLGPAKEVVQIGAAIGREFSHALLAAVARKDGQELAPALNRVVEAGLLFRQGAPPHASYLFKHALVRDAAYSTLLRSRRQQLHDGIIKTLESQFPEIVAAQPQVLAQHCTEAGRINEAIDYWTKASQMSLTRSAMVEASLQSGKGLALLDGLIESPERQRKELALQTALGWAKFASKGEGAPEVGEAFIRARALCDELGDRSSLGPVLYLHACHLISAGQYAAALRCAEDQLNLARDHNDSAVESLALQIMGRCSHWRGAFASAIEHFEHALGISVPEANDCSLLTDTSKVVASSYLAFDLLVGGYLDRAAACRDQAVALGRRSIQRYSLATALAWGAPVDWLRGAQLAAVECLTELAALARRNHFSFYVAVADLGLARFMSARAKSAEGLALARQAVADQAWGKRTRGLVGLAYCCKGAGEVGEALELLDKALEVANATDERWNEAEIHWLKGQCLLEHHPARQAEAESSYQRALAVARGQQAKFWELHAAISLARLWRDQGERTEARDLLAPIYGWFTEGFDTVDLKEAKALLEQLGA